MKRILGMIYLVISICMVGVMGYGVYGLVTAPAKAMEAQKEIEEMLRRKQEEEERKRQERLAQALIDKENSFAQEDGYNPAILYREYEDASQMRVTGIGDSVMLAALSALYDQFPNGYFDAKFGRTLYEGENTLYELEAAGSLGDVIVFSLGTNSYITEEDCERLIEHSGGRPTFWLSTFGVSNDSTQIMTNVVNRHDNAYMIDWGSIANEHREYILADGLHPNDLGSQEYAKYICEVITQSVLQGPSVQLDESEIKEAEEVPEDE